MGYTPVSSTELVDDDGAVLAIVVETNGLSWKLFATHRKDHQSSAEQAVSEFAAYPSEEGALRDAALMVAGAKDLGWRPRTEN